MVEIRHAQSLAGAYFQPTEKAEAPLSAAHPIAASTIDAMIFDRYVLATLNATLLTSLMTENTRRVQHLSSGDASAREEFELQRRSNELRKQVIIEEIEVILLSAS